MPRPAMPNSLQPDIDAVPIQRKPQQLQTHCTVRLRYQAQLIAGDGNASLGSIAQFGEEQTAPQVQRAQAGDHFSGTQ